MFYLLIAFVGIVFGITFWIFLANQESNPWQEQTPHAASWKELRDRFIRETEGYLDGGMDVAF